VSQKRKERRAFAICAAVSVAANFAAADNILRMEKPEPVANELGIQELIDDAKCYEGFVEKPAR
jgi:hypothetical protein